MTTNKDEAAKAIAFLQSSDPRNYSRIPPPIIKELRAYADRGEPVRDFLQAVIANQFKQSFATADRDSLRGMAAIANYVYMELPSMCHGSRQIYDIWISIHDYKRRGVDTADLKQLNEDLKLANKEAAEWVAS